MRIVSDKSLVGFASVVVPIPVLLEGTDCAADLARRTLAFADTASTGSGITG